MLRTVQLDDEDVVVVAVGRHRLAARRRQVDVPVRVAEVPSQAHAELVHPRPQLVDSVDDERGTAGIGKVGRGIFGHVLQVLEDEQLARASRQRRAHEQLVHLVQRERRVIQGAGPGRALEQHRLPVKVLRQEALGRQCSAE